MDDHKEVNMIDILINHTFEESCYEDPLEKCLAHFRQNSNIDKSIKEVNAVMYTILWKPEVEPLPVLIFVLVSSIIGPKLDLKLLPDMLKYAFLGDSVTLHMIISLHLDKDQEGKLLDMLSEHKKALGWTM